MIAERDLTAIIVDDEPIARRRLARLLASIGGVEVVAQAGDVAAAVEETRRHLPDLLLLDVRMPGGDGFDVVDALRDAPPAVVFVTAFGHYALPAFAADAVDYLTKPVEEERLAASLLRVRHRLGTRNAAERLAEMTAAFDALRQAMRQEQSGLPPFWVRSRGRLLRVSAAGVTRIDAERDYARLYAEGETYLLDETLASLESRLPAEQFIRVHRSTILRMEAIKGFRRGRHGAWFAELLDGSEVRIGRSYLSCMKLVAL
ncbi:LytTR family DNA-binding domain-containing protein [Shinella sp. CPCC 101442]|uniref:LytR/AlgR family response regulator transcription factor n=1 Tax=Shinella sp. CPCC 101442 TaxID=2932265 RepID=UPI002152902F|nr:LytTR family DNA-binding domain-containing protein [Shinella sp. CPCC 101442]MCR6500058.1 LytTR family DNA-binding domain-containing protein [Shinella sp. CPCC 101442]